MKFSVRSLLYLTAIIAIQLAIPLKGIPMAILVCSGLIFALFAMSVIACVTSETPEGFKIENNRRLMLMLRALTFTLVCFWALFFNSMIRGML